MIPALLGGLAGAFSGVAAAGPLADQVALHLGRDGRVVDSETVGQGYQALCDQGSALACDWRAWDDWGVVKADALARLADPVCAAGDAEACLVLAMAKPDHAQADAFVDQACEQGEVRGCREACRRDRDSCAAPGAPIPVGTCAEGWLAACVEPAKAGEIAALERLCSAPPAESGPDDGAARTREWCTELAAARARTPAERRDARVDLAWATPSGFLLGWRGSRWSDHALVRYGEVRSARIEVRDARQEWLVLDLGQEEPLALPVGCELVAEGLAALNSAGVPVTARDEEGGPARSVCVELSGGASVYVGGELQVATSAATDGGAAREIARALNEASEPLFACTEAAPRSPSAPVEVAIVRAKSGPPKKASLASSSGVPGYDQCVLEWVRATPLGESPLAGRFTVRVALDW